jgi:integrase
MGASPTLVVGMFFRGFSYLARPRKRGQQLVRDDRRTSKMTRADLKAARVKWIKEAKTPTERKERESSDFLKYQNDLGLFADFHSNRHTFITNLERAGVSPRTAQTLARHCDIRLTMGVYHRHRVQMIKSPFGIAM